MAQDPFFSRPHVVVIGAGVIGLAIAWRLSRRGTRVTVFDQGEAGCGASQAAAGMLAACVEAEPGEEKLVALGRASQALWPAFSSELERDAAMSIDRRCEGTLAIALTADDRARLDHHLGFQRALGLPLERISAAQARAREPHLSPNIAGAVFSPEDHQVDNRKLVTALRAACISSGATIRERTGVARIVVSDARATGIVLRDDTAIEANHIVLAAGAWSRRIEGLPAALRPPVRPVKGQMIALRMDKTSPLVRHVIRSPNIYLVPRHDGRLILGATVEESGFDTTLTAGGVLALLEAAWRTIPAIEELAIDEMWVGHRPGSRDDAPVLGPGPVDGLVYATGHHRNGILLAPVTAEAVARFVLEGTVDPAMRPFGIGRFALAQAAE